MPLCPLQSILQMKDRGSDRYRTHSGLHIKLCLAVCTDLVEGSQRVLRRQGLLGANTRAQNSRETLVLPQELSGLVPESAVTRRLPVVSPLKVAEANTGVPEKAVE